MTAQWRLATCLGLACLAGAERAESASLRPEGERDSAVLQVPEVVHQLRICNAFAGPKSLDVYRGGGERLTTDDKPLAYKECRDFDLELRDPEDISFKADTSQVGVFTATGIPKEPSTLLLVVQRRSPTARSASFQSHSFDSQVEQPQVALIDAYQGPARSHVVLREGGSEAEPGKEKAKKALVQAEALRFNSAVVLKPGTYGVALDDGKGKERANGVLNAVSGSYVLLRVGDAKFGADEDLVVFGAAAAARLRGLAVVSLALLAWLRPDSAWAWGLGA